MLNKPFDQITFEDVEDYCKEQHIETAVLDYKQAVPSDLSKHIAAMSNTMGGLIIIGVEEDSQTGLPIKWEGIDPSGKPADRVFAFIANVKPLPSCNVRPTNEKSGKIFILVEVLEGDATPYYPVKDMTTVWIRTGNISTPLKPADRDTIEMLTNKRHKAEMARARNMKKASDLLMGARKLAEQERLARAKGDESIYGESLVSKHVDCFKLTLQPYYPHRELAAPREILSRVEDYRARGGDGFPGLNLKAAPQGIYDFSWSRDGKITCDQLYANGLLYRFVDDILWVKEGRTRLYVAHIAGELHTFLKTAQKFYKLFNYHGLLTGEIALDEIGAAVVHHIVPNGYWSHSWDETTSVANSLVWPLELDTHQLSDDLKLQDYFVNRLEHIYWDLGLEDANVSDVVRTWMKDNRMLVEAP